ncbi:MAG: ABC transporter ATP-binding protein [Bdellovibrionales bacterium]
MSDLLLRATNLKKTYSTDERSLEILKGISLDLAAGQALCITGASGSGKSTLLHILGTLDRADEGSLEFQGRPLEKMSDDEISLFRSQKLGFVFQFHHLLNEFTVLENILMPFWILNETPQEDEARKLLEKIGLGDRLNHYPTQLSGGECQRVALARALVKKPALILADEPTGNLDSQNSAIVQQLLFELQRESGAALIVVTHDEVMAKRFPRRLKLQDGHWLR